MKLLYIGFSQPNSSIDGVYIKGLTQNGVDVRAHFSPVDSWGRYREVIKIFREHKGRVDALIVGYATPQAAIMLRLLTRKPIIYNALCSEYERKIISRGLARRVSLKAMYYWCLDFFACACANFVMLETQHQIDFFHSFFRPPRSKFFLAWTGVDDEKFKLITGMGKYDEFTVLFRGRFLPEAGADVAVKAAKLLEESGVKFIILGNGMELPSVQKVIDELQPRNLVLRTAFLPDDELFEAMQRSHLSLGQLADHDRLKRTIPHKAYESLSLGLPYLTARNPAVMELLREGETCLACNPGDAEDLAKKILWAKDHPQELARIADNGHAFYQQQLTPRILAGKLLEHLEAL